MKKILSLCISIALSIQGLYATCPETCSQEKVVLSGTLSTRTLSASSVYLLRGCVIVPNNVVLTIPAGTVIMGEKATNGTLLIERGGKFISQGTSSSPVIITSDQTEACRAPGDHGGIVVAGHAPNNTGGNFTSNKSACTSIVAGGSNASDSSGVFRYVRIEYASTGLAMLSVGGKTVLNNVQIAHSGLNGMELFGGNVNGRELAFYDNYGNDIEINLGNQSKLQQVLILRSDSMIYNAPSSTAVLIKNNDDAINNYASAIGASNTHPVMSNFTIIGPGHCKEVTDIKFNGVEFTNNAEGAFYNSYIDGVRIGLQINKIQTVNNASVNNTIKFEFNSFYQNKLDADSDISTWTGTCSNINMWLDGFGCSQLGNQAGQSENLSATICGNYCSIAPVFTVSETDLESANYGVLTNPFFNTSLDRGAFTTTNWLSAWATFCTPDYCPTVSEMSYNTDIELMTPTFQLYPNPATQSVQIQWETNAAATSTIRIMNVLGQEVYNYQAPANESNHTLSVADWTSGVYYVQCVQDGKIIQATSLLVK